MTDLGAQDKSGNQKGQIRRSGSQRRHLIQRKREGGDALSSAFESIQMYPSLSAERLLLDIIYHAVFLTPP